jgi:hypothetical protein
MAVVLFCYFGDIEPHAFAVIGVVATLVLAAYLGWKRVMAMIIFAPFVSWLFAWFPLILANILHHHKIIAGLVWGLFWSTLGWAIIGGLEFIALFLMALPFRLVSAAVHRDDTVIIEGPYPPSQ